MEAIRVPITLTPHFTKDKPRGYYLIVQRLFPNGVPILRKQQFLGYCGGSLIITVGSPNHWSSVMDMNILCQELVEGPVTWLSNAKIWASNKGFRSYIPRTLLPAYAERSESHSGTGIFKLYTMAGGAQIYYLEMPMVTGEVLLRRQKL